VTSTRCGVGAYQSTKKGENRGDPDRGEGRGWWAAVMWTKCNTAGVAAQAKAWEWWESARHRSEH
jgi:hypothetical protein